MGYAEFERLCEENGITPYRVAKDIGWNNSIFSNWKAGRSTPKADKRRIIAEYFGVSLEYLDTGDEALRNIEKEVEADSDPNIKELYSIAKKATPEERAAIVRMMKAFFGEQ